LTVVTNEELIEELQKLDARAADLIAAREETLSYIRETNRLVAEERLRYKELDLTLELRRIKARAAAE
jgi:hypothetical protein